MLFGLSLIDLIVIVVYLGIILWIGFRAMFRIKDSEDYFLGGRKFNKLVQIFSAFGQATSADTGPSVSTTTAKNGAAGIWSALMMLFVTPAYWFTGVWYRRLRVLTLGDYFTERFNSKLMGGVYAVFGSISLMILLSVGYISITKTVMIMTPKEKADFTVEERVEYNKALELDKLESRDFATLTQGERQRMEYLRAENPNKTFSYIDKNAFIWITAIIVIIYSMIGGLEAAFYSDVLQGIFILILSILLLPFALVQINTEYNSEGFMGAFQTIHEQLPESFFEIFGSPATMDFTWYYILAISLIAMFNVMVGPNQLVATGSAKNEYTARYGFTFGTYLKRIAIVLWGVTALAITLLFAGSIEDPDLLFGYAANQLLGPLNIGLIGLMIASLTAALMSTADMMMLATSGLLTHNIYKPFFAKRKESHYVNTGRIFGAIVVIGSAIMVMKSDSILNALKANWEFNVIVAAGFWLGILWRRTNRPAVWTSMIASFAFFYVLSIGLPMVFPKIQYNDFLLQKTREQVIERVYTAHGMDVEQREEDILRWELLAKKGKAKGEKPEAIKVGQEFVKLYKQPQRSIFWTQGITYDENGRARGKGSLKMTLVCYQLLGFDLTENKYAFNETLKVLTKLAFPFLLAIAISYIVKRPEDEEKGLDRFYVKMKTPVTGDKEKDDKELALSYENPGRFDHLLLFPKTSWQFTRWNKTDAVGFSIALFMILAILGLLYFFVHLGGKIQF
jgi:SSS family solute:Na+ symporter